jgi:hypothetical protein
MSIDTTAKAIPEGDVVHAGGAVDCAQFGRPVGVYDARPLVEEVRELGETGHRLLERVVQLRQLRDRVERRVQVQDERGKNPDGELAARRANAAVAEDHARPEDADELDQGEEHGARTERLNIRVAPVLVDLSEEPPVDALAPEGLDDLHAAHRLLHERQDGGDAIAHPPVGKLRALAEDERGRGEERERRREPGGRELPVDEEEDGDRSNEVHQRRDRRHQSLRHEQLNGLDVGGQARDESADLLAFEEPQIEMREVVEHSHADRSQGLLAEPSAELHGEPERYPVHHRGDEQHRSRDGELALVAGEDPLVDPVPEEERRGEGGGLRDE